MHHRFLGVSVALFAALAGVPAQAQTVQPQAEFLFVGSYHMNNPGRDVNNLKADDVLSERRQKEIAEVVKLIGRYKPTQVMLEADHDKQADLDKRYVQSCKGTRPLTRDETEQLGFRIACDAGLSSVHAVDWDTLNPIRDQDSIDYLKAIDRHRQQAQYQQFLAQGKAWNTQDQKVLGDGTILDMLKRLNSDAWLQENARSYYAVGLFGTQDDPIGANWVQYWFGRNLAIFNTIARNTHAGDRVLVIYGAGHGNYLRQLAADSGLYRMQDPQRWLSTQAIP